MTPVLIRRVRLGAAFVLLTYLILHFSNHALGLISLDAMETGRRWFLAIWRNPLGTLALYGAITVHGVLALWLLYQRRSLRMPSWEAAQYCLGLVLPALLATHVVGTRIAWWQVGTEDRYARVLLGFWVVAPERGIWQTITLLIAWIHACIGVHYWLRFRRWYPRVVMALFAGALLLPTLALAGYVTGGHEVVTLARTPGWREELARVTHPPSPAKGAVLVQIRTRFLEVYLAALLAVVVARGGRRLWQRRRSIHVFYPGDRAARVPVGFTILEASRVAGIPHASVCGGRGRCSTCRVRVVHGLGVGPAAGCRQALAAARAMVEGLASLSAELAGDLPAPLRIGIGIHAGAAVVGRMGWGQSFYLTAVGDTVHVAARLEQATKDYHAELVVSEDVGRYAGIDLSAFRRDDLAVRNRAGRVPVRVITRVRELP